MGDAAEFKPTNDVSYNTYYLPFVLDAKTELLTAKTNEKDRIKKTGKPTAKGRQWKIYQL